MNRAPNLGEVIRIGAQVALSNAHTCLPAQVTRYDAAKQQADVKPLVRVTYLDEEGQEVITDLPVVPNCPVQFAFGGGMTITFPIAVGDFGILLFAERSIDKWLTGSGQIVDPQFDHTHHLTDGIFIPGIRPFGAPRKTDPGNTISIGVDGGSFQGAALGADIASHLAALKTWADTHVHSSATPGNPTSVAIPVSPTVPDVESDTVKITP